MASSLSVSSALPVSKQGSFSEVFSTSRSFHRCDVGERSEDLSHLIRPRKRSLKISLHALLWKIELTFLRLYGEDGHM